MLPKFVLFIIPGDEEKDPVDWNDIAGFKMPDSNPSFIIVWEFISKTINKNVINRIYIFFIVNRFELQLVSEFANFHLYQSLQHC